MDQKETQPPPPPDDLKGFGREYWIEYAELLTELQLLEPIHHSAFRVMCDCWAEYRRLSDWLAEDPSRMTFETDKGYQSETPQVRQRDNALNQLNKLWMKFGLTPHALAQLKKSHGKSRPQLSRIQRFAKRKYQPSE